MAPFAYKRLCLAYFRTGQRFCVVTYLNDVLCADLKNDACSMGHQQVVHFGIGKALTQRVEIGCLPMVANGYLRADSRRFTVLCN